MYIKKYLEGVFKYTASHMVGIASSVSFVVLTSVGFFMKTIIDDESLMEALNIWIPIGAVGIVLLLRFCAVAPYRMWNEQKLRSEKLKNKLDKINDSLCYSLKIESIEPVDKIFTREGDMKSLFRFDVTIKNTNERPIAYKVSRLIIDGQEQRGSFNDTNIIRPRETDLFLTEQKEKLYTKSNEDYLIVMEIHFGFPDELFRRKMEERLQAKLSYAKDTEGKEVCYLEAENISSTEVQVIN